MAVASELINNCVKNLFITCEFRDKKKLALGDQIAIHLFLPSERYKVSLERRGQKAKPERVKPEARVEERRRISLPARQKPVL